LLAHARTVGLELLDQLRTWTCLWLLEFSAHRALSGRDFPATLPHNFWLNHSGSHDCEYSRLTAYQITWATVSTDASPGSRIECCVLAFACLLEICSAALLQRKLVNAGRNVAKMAVASAVLS